MVFINAFECRHPSDAWSTAILDQSSHGSKCWHLQNVYYSQAAFNIFSDIVILVLPIPVLLRLNMRKNKRVALVAIFSCGGIAVIASGIRIYALYLYSTLTDAAYYGAAILICSQIELNVAIIAASVPSLKPLFKHVFAGTTTVSQNYDRRMNNYDAYGRAGGGLSRSGAMSPGPFKSGAVVALRNLSSNRGGGGNDTVTSNRFTRSHSRDSDEQLFLQKASHGTEINVRELGGRTEISGGADNALPKDRSEISWVDDEGSISTGGPRHSGGSGNGAVTGTIGNGVVTSGSRSAPNGYRSRSSSGTGTGAGFAGVGARLDSSSTAPGLGGGRGEGKMQIIKSVSIETHSVRNFVDGPDDEVGYAR